MAKGRRFEARTYEHPLKPGESIDYKVYFIEGRDSAAIEEAEILKVAAWAGCKDYIVAKPMQTVQDNMFWQDWQLKKDASLPKTSNRYIAYYGVTGPDGTYFEDLGSAAPDNVDMKTMRSYLPELANKRARVRAVILALGLKGINADVEFADGDSTSEENTAKTTAFLKELQMAFDAKKVPQDERKIILQDIARKMGIKATHLALVPEEEQKKIIEEVKKIEHDGESS